MPNQTQHTPQVPSPSGRGLGWGLQIRPPVITKELQRLVEENKKLIKTALPVMEENERRREEERLKQTRQFTWNPEALELSWLEPFNFQVDSSNWWYELDKDWKQKTLNWYPIKENPEKDIWEITMPDLTKEQLFTQDSAIRETKKVWKRMPTGWEWWEWKKIVRPYWDDWEEWYNWEKFSKELWLTMAGGRCRNTGMYDSQSTNGGYWSSSPNTTHGFYLSFNSANVRPTNYSSRKFGFSVRCIVEDKLKSNEEITIIKKTRKSIWDKILSEPLGDLFKN